jgi:rubrerythrin
VSTSLEVIVRYLGDSISAERSLETQFRSSLKDGDDSEVHAFFRSSAERAALHADMLSSRLAALNATEHRGTHFLADILAAAPKAAQMRHAPEEKIAQNLMSGFALSKSAGAMYLALGSAARLARDEQTAELADRLGAEEEKAAESFWHFLPSRSKIAYNVLTAGEVDPAVETRAPDDRVTETLL